MSWDRYPYIRHDEWWRDGPRYVPVTHERCWKCDTPRPDLSHTMFEYIAALLAEPLRKAFDDHLDQHGCAERHGFAYCDEAMRLFRLLPASEQIIIG